MRWLLKQGNILDEMADVLVCSANVNLTLSGGVGAELFGRYGDAMRRELHERLQLLSPHCAQRGEIVAYTGTELPYKAVLNAVAIDGWYESSPDVITAITKQALLSAATYGANKVALTALATGFGRLSFAEFAQGIRPLLNETIFPIQEIVICLLLDFEVAELARSLPEIECVTSIIPTK